VRFFNWGLPSTAALVVLLAVLFGGWNGSGATTQVPEPGPDAVTAATSDTERRWDCRFSRPREQPLSSGAAFAIVRLGHAGPPAQAEAAQAQAKSCGL